MAEPAGSTTTTLCRGLRALTTFDKLTKLSAPSASSQPPPILPQTSPDRLLCTSANPDTILYLAYGSNLSSRTFKGTRGIRPLSSINAHIPSLALTFDLAGIPYIEPCFANTRYRHTTYSPSPSLSNSSYHKDRWHKGLIGVVYEVTPSDYRTIIATEGGGASYQDIVVPCYVIPKNSTTIDPEPKGASFLAHTLLQPRFEDDNGIREGGGRIQRPNPSYAQASSRYLKLITDGGEEHGLPSEYLAFLYNLKAYTITTYKQRAGQALFVLFWGPLVAVVFGSGRLFADEEGKIPGWLVRVMGLLFGAIWGSYDSVFKKVFGDGERTIVGKERKGGEEYGFGFGCGVNKWCEKGVRLEEHGHMT